MHGTDPTTASEPPPAWPWTPRGTCRVTDVQVYHVLLVHKEHLEVLAAGRQNCLMGFEVNTVHHKSAVTQQSQLPLLVQLLQDVLAVLGKIHGCGKPEGLRVSTERTPALLQATPELPGEKRNGEWEKENHGRLITPDSLCKPRLISGS